MGAIANFISWKDVVLLYYDQTKLNFIKIRSTLGMHGLASMSLKGNFVSQ